MNANNQIGGLLTQKPDSPVPNVGDKRRFSVIEKTGRSGKPYNKIKSEGEGYGQLYEIVIVQKTDHIDNYGNVSFNVSLAPANGNGNGAGQVAGVAGGALTKDEYWSRKEARDIEGQRRMGRASAQRRAIEYATLKGLTDIKPEDLRALIGWFERDVDRGLQLRQETDKSLTVEPEPQPGDSGDPPQDEGFDL